MKNSIRELISSVAANHGVDDNYLYSLVMVESAGKPWVSRIEYHYPYLVTPKLYSQKLGITESTEVMNQRTSYGLVQIMGGVARELGWQSHLPKIFTPHINLNLGLTLIKKLMKKYDDDMDKVSAAYNWGHASMDRTTGKFKNQSYVDKINKIYRS